MFLLRLAEKGFVIFSFLLFTDAVTTVLYEGQTDNPLLIKLIYHGVGAITILLLAIHWRKVVPIVVKVKLLWFLTAIALASVFWSASPVTTLSRSVALVRATSFGVYVATRYSLKEQLRLLAWTMGLAILLSLVFALVLPSYGIMGMGEITDGQHLEHAGTWRGIYSHKNYLGRIMALSAIVFFLLADSTRSYRWAVWVGFGLSVSILLLSTSKTALIILLIIIALLPLYKALRWNYTLALPLCITVIVMSGSAGVLLLDHAETVASAFGKDLSLTGRTDIWILALEKIRERPWLGYGYGGFWLELKGESEIIWRELKWEVPHAHNGFLDLSLDLGLLGLIAFLLTFIMTCLRAFSWVRLTRNSEGILPLAYLTYMLLSNLTESVILRPNAFWILYILMIISMQNSKLVAER